MHTAIVAKENAQVALLAIDRSEFLVVVEEDNLPHKISNIQKKKKSDRKNQVLHITHNIHTQRTKSNQLNNCKRYNKPIMYQDNKNITKSTVKEKKNKKERKEKYIYPTPPLTHRHHHYLLTY